MTPIGLQELLDPEFWRRLAPSLTIEGQVDLRPLRFTSEQEQRLTAQIGREAYVHLSQPGLNSPLAEMREVLTVITQDLGLPPVFAFAFDEFWTIHLQVRPLVNLLLETNAISLLPDFWAWRVEPGTAGWKPHRDKVHGSLFPNGKPKSITVWVPLSIAHPRNGCIYIVPADRDAGYYQDSAIGRAPLQDIRALPADAGDVLAWTQRAFHWGSTSAAEHDLPPRQSVAFEYQRNDVPPFNAPLLDPDCIPDFNARMALIGKQIQQYTSMYEFTPELLTATKSMLKKLGLP